MLTANICRNSNLTHRYGHSQTKHSPSVSTRSQSATSSEHSQSIICVAHLCFDHGTHLIFSARSSNPGTPARGVPPSASSSPAPKIAPSASSSPTPHRSAPLELPTPHRSPPPQPPGAAESEAAAAERQELVTEQHGEIRKLQADQLIAGEWGHLLVSEQLSGAACDCEELAVSVRSWL